MRLKLWKKKLPTPSRRTLIKIAPVAHPSYLYGQLWHPLVVRPFRQLFSIFYYNYKLLIRIRWIISNARHAFLNSFLGGEHA